MGAHDFSHLIRGENNVHEAYRKACEEALHEHGSDPYNGTISTTNGAVQVESRPVTLQQAYEIEQEFWRSETKRSSYGIHKWGPCGAIPLLAESKAPNEQRTKKVTLDAVEFASFQKGNQDVIRGELKPLKGYELLNFRIKETDLTTKVETKATDGDRETRYIVEGSIQHLNWATGFPSQAEARAFIDEAAKAEELTSVYSSHNANKEWGIYAITRRADGSPLVRTRRIVKRAVLTVEYDMAKIPDTKVQDGWYFFGLAAS